MKVLINATVAPATKAGLGVYARSLVDYITRDAGQNEFIVLAQDDDPEFDFSDRVNVTTITVQARWFRKLPFRFLLEQVYVPLLLWHRRVDVVHSLHYALPLLTFGTRRVVTFHDMTFFNMPEVHEPFKVFYFQNFMKASVRLADHLIFVSQSALDDCERRLGPLTVPVKAVPLGKGNAFTPMLPPERLKQVRQKYGLSERFVLYVGTIEPRKNLTRLVEAFASLAPRFPELQLVLAGAKGWLVDELFQTLKSAGLGPRVVLPGFIDEQDKPALLAACTLFVYPSLYEGFGLPILEAMASGAPVITSNVSSLPEVAGQAARLIDPHNTYDLLSAMDQLLRSEEQRNELRHLGSLQAARFTWERTAEQTVAVYARAVAQGQTTRSRSRPRRPTGENRE